MELLKLATDWAKAEVFSTRFFIIFAVLFLIASAGFWQLGKTELAKAYIIPMLVAGVLLMTTGLGLFFTNKARIRHQYFTKSLNYRTKFRVTKEQYESYYKCTIVRNPWSRAVSFYKNVLREDLLLTFYKISSEISFREFLLRFVGKGALKPQSWWLRSFDGSLPFDYIGKFENLEEATKKIFKDLGIENTALPHLLKGSEEDYAEFFDDETYSIVSRIYKEEIDMFGYSF